MPATNLVTSFNGFNSGDRVRVARGTRAPIGLTGTIFKIQLDPRFGKHKVLLEDTSIPNFAGINRATPFLHNCERIQK